jgi:hypothetical protein
MSARGNTPGDRPHVLSSALTGRRFPAPLRGAPQWIGSKTQAAALAYHPPSLSAPEYADSAEPWSVHPEGIFVTVFLGQL